MKKWVPILFLVVACNRQTLPVITDRNAAKPKIDNEIYPPAGTVKEDLVIGKTIFTNRCGRCHGLPDPALFQTNKWESILTIMIPRAKLNQEQAVHVRAYVLENAAKSQP
ncbi:MAG TPA: hypothetical protein PK275_10675 [Chitinophagaceae bacterium]|jgi:mono/diheme cytochrome c family protein|nr:hypothetical protein [Chitinophagaceae bacterium]